MQYILLDPGYADHLSYESITLWAMIETIGKTLCRQFSKMGQTQELFQRWRSFQFDEATDTIDSYVLSLKQCTKMIGYNKGHILELFMNSHTHKILFFYVNQCTTMCIIATCFFICKLSRGFCTIFLYMH